MRQVCKSPPPGWQFRLNFFELNSVNPMDARTALMNKKFKDDYGNVQLAPWEEYHRGQDMFATAVDIETSPNSNAKTCIALMVIYPPSRKMSKKSSDPFMEQPAAVSSDTIQLEQQQENAEFSQGEIKVAIN